MNGGVEAHLAIYGGSPCLPGDLRRRVLVHPLPRPQTPEKLNAAKVGFFPLSDAFLLLPVRSVVLTIGRLYSQLCLGAFVAYNSSFSACNWSFLAYNWSFSAYSAKVRLNKHLNRQQVKKLNCKQKNLQLRTKKLLPFSRVHNKGVMQQHAS